MKAARRFLWTGLFALAQIALVAAPAALLPSAAHAAPGEFCFVGPDGNQPGLYEQGTLPEDPDVCVPDTSFLQGMQCGTGSSSYFNSTQGICIANAEPCTISGVDGAYANGQCQIAITPPTTPTITGGLAVDPNGGTAPTGEMQPMCVNASPFIGGGMFVVSGTVLCYEGAGRPTGIHAYTDNGSSGGWNPFDRDSWDSLYVMNDLFAGDDITAIGTISSFGGAQFFSPNGLNGLQVNNSGIAIHAQDNNGNVAAITTTPGNIIAGATNGTAQSSLQISGEGRITGAATNGTGGSAAHVIDGDGSILATASDGAGGASHLVDGEGRVTTSATDGTAAASVVVDGSGSVFTSASDGTNSSLIGVSGTDGIGISGHAETSGAGVAIGGKVGATSTAGVGTAITGSGQGGIANPTSGPAGWADVAIGSVSFAPGTGQGAGILVNDYGVTVASAATGNSFNSFGSAANTVAGANVVNAIGAGGAGNVLNAIGSAGLAGSTTINAIGTGNGGGATTNVIGNTHAQTAFGAQAGTSSIVAIQGALDFATGQGASILAAPTQQVSGGSGTTMLGATGRHVVSDANGRLTMINGVAAQASSALYIVNGHGVTNGVVVTEQSAALSGGTSNPTSLALSDTGARFSNANTGAPVRVSGIADGVGPFDGANIRQLHSGIASVAALAGLPAPQAGKNNSIGFAMGYHGSGTALALGGQSLLGQNFTVKYGAALGYAGGLVESTASVGIGMSW